MEGGKRMTEEDFVKANPGVDLGQLKAQMMAKQGGPPPVGQVTHGELGMSSFALGSADMWKRGDDIFLAASEGENEKVVGILDAGANIDEQVNLSLKSIIVAEEKHKI
jgi:hypothetical protein